MRAVGSSMPRVDAADKVTGRALYPGDINVANQAWLKIVFAGVPHARIRGMDVSTANAASGVIAVLTAADVPVNEYGLIMPDQPALCGLGSTPQAEVVRWEADHIALVVAETQAQAEAAAELIVVDYESLPVVTDPFDALKVEAPILHPHLFSSFPYGMRDRSSNVLHTLQIENGDVDAAFDEAHVLIESTYYTHSQEHGFLQPEAGIAYIRDDGRIEVVCGGQWMHEEREQIAHALGLDDEQIVVRYPAIGGAFGGREDISIQIALALAAWKTGRPVKTVWTREESIIGHHKRHPFTIHAKWAATRDGHIVAADVELLSDAGAYAYTSTKVLGNALLACLGPYEIPNVRVLGRTVYTNNCPSGAFRGFGGPQGHFAAEMQVSKLAEALEMDPVELRRRNVWRDGSVIATRSVVPAGCTAAEVLETAASHSQQKAPSPDIGIQFSLDAGSTETEAGQGLALSFKNVGFSLGAPESCNASIILEGRTDIDRAIVSCVGADVGQGAHSAFIQFAADALGIKTERVELHVENTDVAGSSGSASASRMTFMAGNAILGAAERALQLWSDEVRPARADYDFHPRPTTAYAPITGESDPNITYGYCAQVADITVDVETGRITIGRLISVNDVGKAINPQQVEGQIEGAVAQAVGWTLLENFVQQDGRAKTTTLSTYLMPSVVDVAKVVVPVVLEIPDPQGPLGARGMAEMPFVPTAAAIGAAIHDATGVWIDELPYTPERVWAALRNAEVQ